MQADDAFTPAGQAVGPLSGLKVVEFTHMVMGPAAGLILADLGADVIKVEPLGGDKTRRLAGAGAGYFAMYNRNKRSICVDLKSTDGAAAIRQLIAKADVFVENFRPGALDKLGFGVEALQADNPRLIYCSEKGFLDGPYAHRTALDEIAQMMGGLAYMTGPPGRPLRAGASVIDVTGGMFGAIGVLAALHEREQTGRGKVITASLYETTAFLVGQHMAQKAVTGEAAAPMPARVSAWAIYDVFDTSDADKLFVGVVSDTQWTVFCAAFGFEDWAEDDGLARNTDRVARREEIIPQVRKAFAAMTRAELMDKLERTGLPFAPIARPEDLFDDPHLNEGGLLDMELPGGQQTKLPALPLDYGGVRPAKRLDPPRPGEHTREVLAEAGLSSGWIEALIASGRAEAPSDDGAKRASAQ